MKINAYKILAGNIEGKRTLVKLEGARINIVFEAQFLTTCTAAFRPHSGFMLS
jgi:hypothetical protein